jgi:hypothetical protein
VRCQPHRHLHPRMMCYSLYLRERVPNSVHLQNCDEARCSQTSGVSNGASATAVGVAGVQYHGIV